MRAFAQGNRTIELLYKKNKLNAVIDDVLRLTQLIR